MIFPPPRSYSMLSPNSEVRHVAQRLILVLWPRMGLLGLWGGNGSESFRW